MTRAGKELQLNSREIQDRDHLLPVSVAQHSCLEFGVVHGESDWTSDSRARSRAPPSVHKRDHIRGLYRKMVWSVRFTLYFPQSRYPAWQRFYSENVGCAVCLCSTHHRARGWQCRIADAGRQPRCRMLRLSSCSRPLLWSSPSIPRPAGTRGSTRHVAHILNTIRATTTGHIRTFSTARSFRTSWARMCR